MVTTAIVKIWNKEVGAVAWDSDRQIGSFEYTPWFIDNGWEIAPLKMPLSNGNRIYSFPDIRKPKDSENDTFKGLPGLLADVLPDKYGNRLINAWLALRGRPANSMNPVEQLCFIGKRGMGALEFEPTTFSQDKNTVKVEIDDLVGVARKVLSEREHFHAILGKEDEKAMLDILRIGTSAGGARPKALIAYNSKTGDVRSGQANALKDYDHWLIKLDGVSEEQFGESSGYGRIEYAYYKMALECGIDMTPCELYTENGRAHFMTRRFDREGGNLKHHVQTWCAMNHFDFNEVTSYSYEQLFQTMRELRLPYPAAEEMYRRMVFNVIAQNCDDHTKNFAFRLKKERKWELSPAYDMCHAYRPGSLWVSQHALSINGKRQHITKDDLESLAKAMNIKKPIATIDHINSVVKKWPEFAEEEKVPSPKRDDIQASLHFY